MSEAHLLNFFNNTHNLFKQWYCFKTETLKNLYRLYYDCVVGWNNCSATLTKNLTLEYTHKNIPTTELSFSGLIRHRYNSTANSLIKVDDIRVKVYNLAVFTYLDCKLCFPSFINITYTFFCIVHDGTRFINPVDFVSDCHCLYVRVKALHKECIEKHKGENFCSLCQCRYFRAFRDHIRKCIICTTWRPTIKFATKFADYVTDALEIWNNKCFYCILLSFVRS